jgi:2-desacetyl-2-hydroxyethyl bacteriochlorophyllide A dehydrogenase
MSELDLPPPGAGDAVVQTVYSGISAGTELLAYRGEIDPSTPLDDEIGALSGTFSYPFRYGYSCVGRVERGAGDLAPGSLVFAFAAHQSTLVVPAANLVVLHGVDAREATLFPLVETALQITLDAGAVMDQLVVVMGQGALGVLTALLLQRAGAHVLAVEPRRWRMGVSERLGIDVTDPEDAAATVGRRTGGAGAATVVEVSGNPDALAGSLGLLAHEGTALVASWYGTKPAALPLGGDFHRRRLTIASTQVSTIPARLKSGWTVQRRREVALRLMAELPLRQLATHEYPFARAPEAFLALDRAANGLMHVALAYGAESGD